MKLVQKALATLCLVIGFPVILLGTVDLVKPNSPNTDKDGALAAIAIFGLPSLGLGTWLILNLRHQHKQQSERLNLEQEQLFLQLLQQQHGELTITDFALAAQIPIKEAKSYLDQKATQLDAGFEVSDEGGIIYKFPSSLKSDS